MAISETHWFMYDAKVYMSMELYFEVTDTALQSSDICYRDPRECVSTIYVATCVLMCIYTTYMHTAYQSHWL